MLFRSIPHSRLMIPIRAEHEQASDNMVCEHLCVVSTSLLNMDYDDLLEPEGELDEVVPFQGAVDFAVWPVAPHGAEGEPIVRVVHYPLG